jgi:phosphatidylserine decarboxylase
MHVQKVSEDKGWRMNSPASKADIKRFLKLYEGQVAVDDIADELDSFENFNQFFYRRLRAGARPIAHAQDDAVLTSAADCRLMVFDCVADSQKFWIKVCNACIAPSCRCRCVMPGACWALASYPSV